MKIIIDQYEPKEIIKFIRQSTGLTQEKFANKIGKGKDAVQSYELGRSKMTFDKFIEITKIFDLKITIEEKNSPEK